MGNGGEDTFFSPLFSKGGCAFVMDTEKELTWELASDGDGCICPVCKTDFCLLIYPTEMFKHCPNCGVKLHRIKEMYVDGMAYEIDKAEGVN